MQRRTQFNVGDVVGTAARLCVGKAGVLLGLSLVGAVPAWLVAAALAVFFGEAPAAIALVAAFLQAVASAAGFGWAQAAIVYYVVRSLRAQSPTVGETADQALRKLPHVVPAYFLASLAAALGFFLLVVPGIVLWLMFWVAVPVATVEGGVVSALRRSHELTNGHKWPLLGVLALLLLVLVLVIVAVSTATVLAAPSSPLS